jgi:hypothetical protein
MTWTESFSHLGEVAYLAALERAAHQKIARLQVAVDAARQELYRTEDLIVGMEAEMDKTQVYIV